jgi:MFS transporter, Spinster family, sphingosine-1-phosphate transporter
MFEKGKPMTAETKTDPIAGQKFEPTWVLVAVLAATYLCAFIDRNILALLTEPIKTDMKLNDTEVSVLLGLAFSTFYVICNVPAGMIIDRFGRRGIIGASAVAWSAMTILCGFAGSYWQLFAGRAGVGLAEAFITPSAFALIRDRVPREKRGRAFSTLALAPYLGGATALIAGGALIAAANAGQFGTWPVLGSLRPWQIVLVVVGVVGLPIPVLLIFLKPDIRLVDTRADASVLRDLAEAFAHIGRNLAVYGCLIGYATAGSMVAFGFSAWVPAMMSRKFGLPVSQVGLTSGPILLAASITGLITCGLALDWLVKRKRSVLIYGVTAMICATCAAAAMPLAPTVVVAWTLFGVAVFFAGSFYSVGATLLSQATPSLIMGKVTVVYLLFQNLIGSGLGPTIVALLSDNVFSGPLAVAYALSLYCGTVGVLGTVAALGLARALRRSASAT